jgi:hypothetical protein
MIHKFRFSDVPHDRQRRERPHNASIRSAQRRALDERKTIMRHQDRGSGVRKVLAVIGAASLILFGAVAGSTAASADDASPANMPTGNGKLTIHKY